MPARKSPPQNPPLNRKGPKPSVKRDAVFLNIPYDQGFENLLLAYIAGISAFGFAPRATLEIPFSQRRLERIISLIASSQYSVHDLSRVLLPWFPPCAQNAQGWGTRVSMSSEMIYRRRLPTNFEILNSLGKADKSVRSTR
jgi:hypothetical protein